MGPHVYAREHNARLSKDALKALSNCKSVSMGIRIDPCELSIFDCWILKRVFLSERLGRISWRTPLGTKVI